jgi:hypothetical protein
MFSRHLTTKVRQRLLLILYVLLVAASFCAFWLTVGNWRDRGVNEMNWTHSVFVFWCIALAFFLSWIDRKCIEKNMK